MNNYLAKECSHPRAAETSLPAPTFSHLIDEGRLYDLEEVVNWPLTIDKSPNNYNWLSPIPLDPESLTIAGVPYTHIAPIWLSQRLSDNGEGRLTDTQYATAEAEILRQFEVRGQNSANSMNRLREFAASDNRMRINHEMARRVMQLRAGVARPSAAVSLLAAVPSIGGIEYLKATPPLCMWRYQYARHMVRKHTEDIQNSENENIKKYLHLRMTDENEAPYRYNLISKHGALDLKQNIARAALGNVDMDMIARDSYLGGEANSFGPGIETRRLYAPVEIDITPIDTSAYVRVPKEWFQKHGLELPSGYGQSTDLPLAS